MAQKIKTWDIIPYLFDDKCNPIEEDESYTIVWINRNLNKYGNNVIKKKGQDSVFDQLSNEEFEIIIKRLEISNNKIKYKYF